MCLVTEPNTVPPVPKKPKPRRVALCPSQLLQAKSTSRTVLEFSEKESASSLKCRNERITGANSRNQKARSIFAAIADTNRVKSAKNITVSESPVSHGEAIPQP